MKSMLMNIIAQPVALKTVAIRGKYMISIVHCAAMRYIKKKVRKNDGCSKVSQRKEPHVQ